MKECSFCTLAVREKVEAWNRPLLETSHFVVLPSLGALVEGWLLIVPKVHFISLGELPTSLETEFLTLKSEIVQLTESLYGAAALFEHGPSSIKRQVGCGVDHAHLHIVPTIYDLKSEVAPFLPNAAQWQRGDLNGCRDAYRSGNDYLYLEQPVGHGFILKSGQLGSQLFRRAIARSMGIEEQFNWREHPQFVAINSTIESVGKAMAAGSTCLVGSENAA
jgi:ATP adenylyltransferase